jgi:3-phosphoglycerate kinase
MSTGTTIIGGGDIQWLLVAQAGVADRMTHISTAAARPGVPGRPTLPGVAALTA